MIRRISSRSSLVILFATLLLFACSIGAFAENKGAGLRQAVKYSHECIVPYNIEAYGYTTGIHIVPFSAVNEQIKILFFCGGDAYASKIWTLPPEGLTMMASGFLPAGVRLKFPTMLMIESLQDPSDSSREIKFWVTQFLFTGDGFSHQTFTSYALPPAIH